MARSKARSDSVRFADSFWVIRSLLALGLTSAAVTPASGGVAAKRRAVPVAPTINDDGLLGLRVALIKLRPKLAQAEIVPETHYLPSARRDLAVPRSGLDRPHS